MHRKLADACSIRKRRRPRSIGEESKRPQHKFCPSQKEEPSIESTEATNSLVGGMFVPLEIELQSKDDASTDAWQVNLDRERTSLSSRVALSRRDHAIAWFWSVCFFASQTWVLLRSDGISVSPGRKYQRRPWWKTEFARAVSFCVLVPFVLGARCCLPILFPVLLFSGFLQSDETVYACNVKRH